MSLRYRSKVDESLLTMRFCVEVGNETFSFDNAQDAASAFSALDRAVGVRRWERFTVNSDEAMADHEYCTVPLKTGELKLERLLLGTRGEVEAAIEWIPVVKCDGTGVCGCWRAQDGHSTPDGWQEYKHEGVTKHMCSECQTKEVKFTLPKLSC